MAVPREFPEQNKVLNPPAASYSANVTSVEPMGVWSDGEQCVSCWRLSWRERVSALFFGRVWLAVLVGATQPPVFLEARRQYFVAASEVDKGTAMGNAPQVPQ